MLMRDNKYEIAPESRSIVKKSVSSFYKTIFLITPAFIVVNYIVSYRICNGSSIQDEKEFWLLFIILSLISSFFTIGLPLMAIRRYKSIVTGIFIKENKFEIALYNEEVFSLTEKQLNIKTDEFRLQNKSVATLIIYVQFNKRSFVLEPFFKDYSGLKSVLLGEVNDRG